VDARIASAVNALGVPPASTPPIAVLDTGVTAVPELVGRVVSPFDALAGTADGSDLDGHGTEVAGIAAGAAGLVEGVSPTSPVMPVRIFNRLGDSSVQAVVAGIDWAVANGAAAVNISSATPLTDVSAADVTALTRAITNAFNRKVLVVASAGNEGTPQADVPAVLPHVLTVGASDLLENRAAFSNTGPWVDLVSPAVSLVAPSFADACPSGYAVANGTSFAAPAVAGAVAVLAQLRPELSAQQRFDVIRTSAHDLPPAGRDDDTGFGLLNVQAAVSAKAPAPESSQEVDDDPFYLRGANAARHPLLLAHRRQVQLSGEVSPAKDPADVYRVKLGKGTRFVASARVGGANSFVFLALWRPSAGNFDVSNDVAQHQVATSGGFSPTPQLDVRVKKGGNYFVSIEAPDAVDPDDLSASVPASERYRLVLSKSSARPKQHRSKHR
jgi:hypothetical protein